MESLNHMILHTQSEVSETESSFVCVSDGLFDIYFLTGHPPPPVFTCTLVNNSKSVQFIWDYTYNTLNAIDHYSIATLSSNNISTCYKALPTWQIAMIHLVHGVYNSLNVTSFNCGDQASAISKFWINLHSMAT